MAEYIEKTLITTELPFVMMKYGNYFNERQIEKIVEIVYELENSIEAADVQPLSVVAEHIKKRLYETAFNTSEVVARNAIADMAGRVDWWINELKDGDAQ